MHIRQNRRNINDVAALQQPVIGNHKQWPITELAFEMKQKRRGLTVGPTSAGEGRPRAGGCGAPGGGNSSPQFVRARICSAVAAVTK
jgi:hypothetical protein